jgi:lysophospholipase L1-like esterase
VDRKILYGGLLVALAGVGLARALRGPRITAGESKILLIGDSLAVGLAPQLKALADEGRVEFASRAIEGTRIDQWAKSERLKDKLRSFRPDLVLVSLGTNDAYATGIKPEQQRVALDALVARLREAGAQVVWIGPPALRSPPNPQMLRMIREAVPSSHYFPSETLDIPRAPDGLHPTLRGYAGWAGSIWQWLA